MKPSDFQEFIHIIIDLIPLIYPGIISISVYNFMSAITTKENKLFLIKAVSIGYLFNLCLGWLKVDNVYLFNGALLISSFVLPFIIYKFIHSNFIINLLNSLKIYTAIVDNDIQLMCSGQKKGNYVRIYLKNEHFAYEGYVRTYEKEHDRKRYIILAYYKFIGFDDNYKEILIYERNNKLNDQVLIYEDDVKRIEKYDYESIPI